MIPHTLSFSGHQERQAGQEGHEEGDEEGPGQGNDSRGHAHRVRGQGRIPREGPRQVPTQVREGDRIQNFWREKVRRGEGEEEPEEHAIKRMGDREEKGKKWLSESESRS